MLGRSSGRNIEELRASGAGSGDTRGVGAALLNGGDKTQAILFFVCVEAVAVFRVSAHPTTEWL